MGLIDFADNWYKHCHVVTFYVLFGAVSGEMHGTHHPKWVSGCVHTLFIRLIAARQQ